MATDNMTDDKDALAQAYLRKMGNAGGPLTEEQSREFRKFLLKIGVFPASSASRMLEELQSAEDGKSVDGSLPDLKP